MLKKPLVCLYLQSVDTVCTLYQSFQEGTGPSTGGLMDRTKDAAGRQAGAAGETSLLRPCHKHMSATERLRKVIQELVDTEKSYVKVRPPLFPISCLSATSSQLNLTFSHLAASPVFLGDARQFFRPVPYLRPDLGCMGGRGRLINQSNENIPSDTTDKRRH